MHPRRSAFLLAILVTGAATAAENTIVEYAAPSGTPTSTPPAPYTEEQFAYQRFIPDGDDPNQHPLHYRLFTPPSYADSGEEHPLVFFLHGDGEEEDPIRNQHQLLDNGQYAFCSDEHQAIFPCFFAQVQTGTWGRETFSRTAVDLTAALAAKYRIDPDRVFVTGLSSGGAGAMAWVGREPGNWAGYVALSPPTPDAPFSYWPASLATVPAWFFGAADDGLVPPSVQETQFADLRSHGARPIYTLYDTGNHLTPTWVAAYGTKALATWLAGLRRGEPDRQPVEIEIAEPTTETSWTTDATTTGLAGTTTDHHMDDGDSEIVQVSWTIGDGVPQTTGGTIGSWESTADRALAPGSNRIVATATGSSFNSVRGGATIYCDVLLLEQVENAAPSADAGPDRHANPGTGIELAGSVNDDSLPRSSTLTSSWSMVSGPAAVDFATPDAPVTDAHFTAEGTYVLRLTANDGALSDSDDTTVIVDSSDTGEDADDDGSSGGCGAGGGIALAGLGLLALLQRRRDR